MRAAALVAAMWLALAALPALARADGDPASDVLATQPLFVPQDAGISLGQQGQLATLVEAAARSGYPIRVAVIASRSDLGSVTELWRQPQTYAQFLRQELGLVYRGRLLVVMPNGLGYSNRGSSAGGEGAVLREVHAPGGGLAGTALTAIQRLAGATGHSLAIPPPRTAERPSRTEDTIALVAFVIGAALVALAWAASLRARPPKRPRRLGATPS